MIPILIVDDSREDLVLAERIFRQCKIANSIDVASSGAACIDYLEKRYGARAQLEAKPIRAMVFLDLGMPPMSGVQTMEAINALELSDPPWIIMLSGMTDVKQIRRGYELGARTFINKPLRNHELQDFFDCNHSRIRMHLTYAGYELDWM